ncbi:Putative Na(+)/H(+) exchanger protein, CPA1 family precursor [Candidatus Purcelliella pentastirinorum]|uniref:Na(+)/H(+) exchanger protein, CPA1 family n=1 Tax=Candidatus Purcelliella pentastirinorum TaxID=472834 RepID=A0A346E065_9ENTR|nr:Na+/H+ antiporter [Candidatus Purcelliella pentastirinorum]AXN02370.1 Putative Na(+)/H(+) exchanger protein, CPA1 family precursor [Candidatus Purcelliella pentastirinorum]
MEIFFTILIMTLVVSLSGIVSKIIPFKIPLPLMQITAGALLAWPKFGLHVDFDPELFLVLFIPPLLFVDGLKTPINEFLNNGREIIALALILVIITVIGIGYLISWITPGISLTPAFALAAVLSPTDAVALSGILGKRKIPKKIMTILNGEALMNDASGLVSLKFSVAVATGSMIFTIPEAILEFLKIAIGGLLSGIIVCKTYGKLLKLFRKWSGDDTATQTILLLLLPFTSYLIAEHLGVSGILASVASGMTINKFNILRQAPLTMRLRAKGVWQMLEFVFNGIVFLMLGLQLPDIIQISIIEAKKDPNVQLWILLCDIIIIYISLIIVRFIWLWVMKHASIFLLKKHPLAFTNYSNRELLITSFAGVCGAITLAGILSIPLYLNNGSVFPARYELIFIATGVILFSLIIGVIFLPIMLKGIDGINKINYYKELQLAKAKMADLAIESLYKIEETLIKENTDNIDTELLKEVNTKIIGNIRNKINTHNDLKQAQFKENLEKRLRLVALRAERTELYHMRATKKISNEIMLKLSHDLDLMEALLTDIEE